MTIAPATGGAGARSIDDVRDAVRDAIASRSPLRIRGAGTWLRAGAPVPASRRLDLSPLSGIVEYVPGDLTLTARAGTTLAEIADATRAHGQWLPLDPFGSRDGTLGATLATASAGPLAASIGLPRDVAVGLAFVAGDGHLVHGGGKVVKNVAGFDLVRLTIGAWGTLGVIVEATVRLRARPEVDSTVALGLPPEREALTPLLERVRSAPIEPLAAELVSAGLAARLGLAPRSTLLVRVAGNPVGVAHQVATLKALGPCVEVDAGTWMTLQASDPADGIVVRVSRRPSELARLWSVATTVPELDAHATLARGIVRLRLTSDRLGVLEAFEAGDRRVTESGGHGAPTADDALARRLRLAFDPHGILNPGIMGGAP